MQIEDCSSARYIYYYTGHSFGGAGSIFKLSVYVLCTSVAGV